jgi:hypothetical protein
VTATRGRPHCLQVGKFLGGKDAATREDPYSLRRLKRETGAAARHHVDNQLRVLPIRELGSADIDRAAFDRSEENVLLAGSEFIERIAHRRAAIAASAGLMKQQRTMLLAQSSDHSGGGFGDSDALDHAVSRRKGAGAQGGLGRLLWAGQKKPSGFGL